MKRQKINKFISCVRAVEKNLVWYISNMDTNPRKKHKNCFVYKPVCVLITGIKESAADHEDRHSKFTCGWFFLTIFNHFPERFHIWKLPSIQQHSHLMEQLKGTGRILFFSLSQLIYPGAHSKSHWCQKPAPLACWPPLQANVGQLTQKA